MVLGIITVVGSIASILGAVWAYKSRNEASKFADAAEKAKDQVVGRLSNNRLNGIIVQLRNVQDTYTKYSYASNLEQIGANFDEDGRKLGEAINLINEHSQVLDEIETIDIQDTIDILNDELRCFSTANTQDERREASNTILLNIRSLISNIRAGINNNLVE